MGVISSLGRPCRRCRRVIGYSLGVPFFPERPFFFSSRTPLGVGKEQSSDPPWTPEYMESRDIFIIIISSELASSNWKLHLDFLPLTFSLTSFIPTFLFLFSWMHSSFQKQLYVGQHISGKNHTPSRPVAFRSQWTLDYSLPFSTKILNINL
jgi:hypothetical protein